MLGLILKRRSYMEIYFMIQFEENTNMRTSGSNSGQKILDKK